ncbi:isoprenylcysteine carboxylmethyltransferase family protein [Govanella unica]|uniref:Protein-S-isoprenylcysteine O-methyltransferase n=1 Tax=Govanella unica TaxID=2975056 RepID=A0A9X3TX41_9PROT|nr:isoprenylcysteine carboxylmethyltransferase family protein [Govania unica]MDA5193566.1 protein-S-isoprenylcysteine O-methyltransferase [Govania unica]
MALIAALAAVAVVLTSNGQSTWQTLMLAALALATPLVLSDIFLFKVYNRPSAGLGRSRAEALPGAPARVATKLLGLWLTLGIIAIGYWLFPEYQQDFYSPYFTMLKLALPVFLVAAVPYFLLIDRRMSDPHDGYWLTGRLMFGLLPTTAEARRKLREHLLGWTIKAFFLPLMTIFLYNNVGWMLSRPVEQAFADFHVAVHWWITLGFFLDVIFAFVGYTLTMRLLDSHIRSSNPLLLGWMVALMCYKPFWTFIDGSFFSYGTHPNWQTWLRDSPTLYTIWGVVLIILVMIYAGASVVFGLRFSNLTHRGVLTNGPYRFTKHPAYVAKNIYWWLVSVPFLSAAGPERAVQASILLFGVNVIYFLRARTEEKHLSEDPDYVAYALWINEHGLFRRLGRLIPALSYKAPDQASQN